MGTSGGRGRAWHGAFLGAWESGRVVSEEGCWGPWGQRRWVGARWAGCRGEPRRQGQALRWSKVQGNPKHRGKGALTKGSKDMCSARWPPLAAAGRSAQPGAHSRPVPSLAPLRAGYTPLHMASGYLHTTTVNALMQAGADPEQEDAQGRRSGAAWGGWCRKSRQRTPRPPVRRPRVARRSLAKTRPAARAGRPASVTQRRGQAASAGAHVARLPACFP